MESQGTMSTLVTAPQFINPLFGNVCENAKFRTVKQGRMEWFLIIAWMLISRE